MRIEEKTDKLIMTFGPKNSSAELQPIGSNVFRIYFLGDAGANQGEAHWGIALFEEDKLILEGYENFEKEKFVLNRIVT